MARRRRTVATQVSLAVFATLLWLSPWPSPWSRHRSSNDAHTESACFVPVSAPHWHGTGAPGRGVHRSARGGAEEGKQSSSAATATAEAGEDDAAALARQAATLREEAAAQQALLESQKRLREEKAKLEAPEEEEDAKELERLLEKLLVIRPKLRKAEAFSLPELGELRKEVDGLESRCAVLKAKLQPPPAPAPPAQAPSPSASASGGDNKNLGGLTRNGKKMSEWIQEDWEALATMFEASDIEQRFDLGQSLGPDGRKRVAEILKARDEVRQKEEDKKREQRLKELRESAKELRKKITIENVQAMSNEERLGLAKEVGPSYLTSLAIVATCFWAIGLPILTYAYYDATGKYPDIFTLFTSDSITAAGGWLAGVLATYALLKPVRLLLALFLTPWTVENVMPYLPWAGMEEEPEEERGNKTEGKSEKSGGDGKK